ncbi:MAG: ABC transporter permease [Chloroflexia bacterium]|nr:ABC transporter permease [Chloroflexia bacterium]MDQ3410756.1 ABC transporter permease [Chloroflexota bacterium]
MSAVRELPTAGGSTGDERVAKTNPIRGAFGRPEMGAVAGAIVVWAYFAIVAGGRGFLTPRGTASYLEVAAELGILAIAVALLMIGGEFDLSIGSMIGAAGMMIALLTVQYGWNLVPALLVSLAFALLIGAANGFLILRTGLPSFIVTLATLFIVRGATIGITRAITGRTQVGGLQELPGYEQARGIFASEIEIAGAGFPISIVWWLGLAALATWVLLRTRFGNWVFGVGGNQQAARNVGVPIAFVKIALFMMTAAAAWLVAVIQVLNTRGADVLRGEGREFIAIIAVVIGGTLLTGGYGSAIGAVFGALIYGMVSQGVVYAGVDADWVQAFLGGMLLAAVLVNRYIRSQATESRR